MKLKKLNWTYDEERKIHFSDVYFGLFRFKIYFFKPKHSHNEYINVETVPFDNEFGFCKGIFKFHKEFFVFEHTPFELMDMAGEKLIEITSQMQEYINELMED